MEEVLGVNADRDIYLTEQVTPFFRMLKRRYPRATGSEFSNGRTPSGKKNWLRVRSEDVTKLSFADSSFDLICSSDVLEHVPDYPRALREFHRCLRKGGSVLISVPFLSESPQTLVRARVNADGSIEHLLPPEYHGDPLNAQGILCYYHFGWDFMESLRAAGFEDPGLYSYWSPGRGYLGGTQFLMAALKKR